MWAATPCPPSPLRARPASLPQILFDQAKFEEAVSGCADPAAMKLAWTRRLLSVLRGTYKLLPSNLKVITLAAVRRAAERWAGAQLGLRGALCRG